MKIKLVDLGKQYVSIKDEVDFAIQNCIDETRFIGGPPVNHFATEFAQYCTTEFCATCGNGTDALEIVLKAIESDLSNRLVGFDESTVSEFSDAVTTEDLNEEE